MLADPQPLPALSERVRATIKPATKPIESDADMREVLR